MMRELPRLSRVPVLPRGPRLYAPPKGGFRRLGGPGSPPPGFVGATTSASEWIWYWASFKALRPDLDPRIPPFRGIPNLMDYQSPELGAFTRALGSAVVDFVYFLGSIPLMVRIQTAYWHVFADSKKQASDQLQLASLSSRFEVVDVYESDYLADATGQAAVVLCKETLGLIRRPDPIAAGTGRMVRNPVRSS